MQIGLLRHGETRGEPGFRGHTDDPLTTSGLIRMWRTVAGTGDRWDRLISSPLVRCAKFAREYAEPLGIVPKFDERLKEMHFGAWEGRTATQLMAETPQALTRFWNAPDKYRPPGGEPLAEFQARVLEAWNDITGGPPRRRMLIVTHAGVIRVLLCHLRGRPASQLLSFEVRHGDMFRVRLDENGSTLSVQEPATRG